MSEFLAMMKVIREDGHFVCKLFDTFSHITNSLIYLLTLIFEKVYIVKPIRSRIVNSERYLFYFPQLITKICCRKVYDSERR